MAPDAGDVEEDRLVVALGSLERFVIPITPLDFIRAIGSRRESKTGHRSPFPL